MTETIEDYKEWLRETKAYIKWDGIWIVHVPKMTTYDHVDLISALRGAQLFEQEQSKKLKELGYG